MLFFFCCCCFILYKKHRFKWSLWVSFFFLVRSFETCFLTQHGNNALACYEKKFHYSISLLHRKHKALQMTIRNQICHCVLLWWSLALPTLTREKNNLACITISFISLLYSSILWSADLKYPGKIYYWNQHQKCVFVKKSESRNLESSKRKCSIK